MTCIAAWRTKDKTFMACDMQATGSRIHQLHESTPKIIRLPLPSLKEAGDLVIGISGTPRIQQVMKYMRLPMPVRDDVADSQGLEKYLVTKFMPALRKTLADAGCERVDNSVSEVPGHTSGIIAYRGMMWEFYSDYQLVMPATDYTAIGSGGHIALGAMYAIQETVVDTDEIRARGVEVAVRAAIAFNQFCGGKTHTEVAE